MSSFIENTRQSKEQFLARKNSILETIAENQRKAVAKKKSDSFREKISQGHQNLDKLQEDLWSLINEYCQKMRSCVDADECELTRLEFIEAYDKTELMGIKNIKLHLEEINAEFNTANDITKLRTDSLSLPKTLTTDETD